MHPQIKLRPFNIHLSRETLGGLASTSVWQIANYLFPLLTFPYLARILGVSGYGVLGIGSAVAGYALLLTDWGFSFSATQAVAREREHPDSVNSILWATVFAKAALGILSSGAIIVGALLFTHDPLLRAVLMVSTLNVAGSVLNVEWVLRGLGQLSKFAAASIIGRFATVPLIFLLVHRPDQLVEAAFAGAAGGLITAAVTWNTVRGLGILRNPRISMRMISMQLKGATHVFLSMVAINIYTGFVTTALGMTAGLPQVGVFTGADRLKNPVQSLLSPLSMVFYSRMGFLAAHHPQMARRTSLVLLRTHAAIGLVLSVGLYWAAPVIVPLLLGSDFIASVPVLQVMSFLILIVAINNVLGTMIMLPFGLKREFTCCITLGALVGLGLVFPLSFYFGAIGAATSCLLAEISVMGAMYFVLVRRLDWFLPFGGIKS